MKQCVLRVLTCTWVMFCTCFVLLPARAQYLPVGDSFVQYARLLQLRGDVPAHSFNIRPHPTHHLLGAIGDAVHPWQGAMASGALRTDAPGGFRVGLIDPGFQTYWNSARPHADYDGAVWQGRGATVAASAGVYLRAGIFSAALRPRVIYTRNADFDLSPVVPEPHLSRYAYPERDGRIDWPQRFGALPFWVLDAGDSYLQLAYGGVAAGVSNQNMWYGPGVRNAIIMTDHAPGFLHGFLSTQRPLDIWIGALQGRWVWGSLQESDYFDRQDDNDYRFHTSLVLDFEPRWVPGLQLGAIRMFNLYPEDMSFGDYFVVMQGLFKKGFSRDDNVTGQDRRDQILSVFGRWIFPESKFETYAEWGRGDHSWDLRDFLVEPAHNSTYILGLQKAFDLTPQRSLLFTAEVMNLEVPKTVMVRAQTGFYVHADIRQGHTQRGQVLGARSGPGSNHQYLGATLYDTWGYGRVFVERTVYDNDLYYDRYESNERHKVELGGGAEASVFLGPLELAGGLAVGRYLNEYYVLKRDVTNVNLTFGVRTSVMGYR